MSYRIEAEPAVPGVPTVRAGTWIGALNGMAQLVGTYDVAEAVIFDDSEGGMLAARLTVIPVCQ